MAKLKEIIEIRTGVFMKESPAPDTFYLQLNDFDEAGAVRPTTAATAVAENKTERHLLIPGDLLLAAKGSRNFCAIVPAGLGRCVASPSFLVLRIRNRDQALPEYLAWYLNLPATRQLLAAQAMGTALPSISKSALEEMEIPLPPLARQSLCAAIARLQQEEQRLYAEIAQKRRLLTDRKLKKTLTI